jgi:endonuclease/exonuclease/phosphatase family metal-dependent hydrolase
MKIMTFNIQHCANFTTGKIDYPLFARTIAESGAEIVALNEIYGEHTKEECNAQVLRLAIEAGYPYAYFARALTVKGVCEYGNALLSKHPILSAETILIPDPPVRDHHTFETRAVLKARLACGLTVLVTHFGLNDSEKENAVRTVMEQIEDERCVLMGDFNVAPDNGLLAPIRERMKDAADAFSTPFLSFPSDVPDRKIDYVFVSPDVTVLSADIPALVVSDHRPHVAEIQFENSL